MEVSQDLRSPCHVIGIWLNFNASPKFRGLSSKIMCAKMCKTWGDFTQLPTLSLVPVLSFQVLTVPVLSGHRFRPIYHIA